MLDQTIKEELSNHFSKLEPLIEICYNESKHEKQHELETLLKDLASTSDKIHIRSSNEISLNPSFGILVNGTKTGIRFTGIPGGHEFSSLVLALLNAGGLGRLPDEGIQSQVKSLQGPIKLRTIMSLSCENCPGVVQALNQMALIHDDFHHEVVDGSYIQNELEEMGIQGVPAVLSESTLLASGRVDFSELLQKLTEHYGINEDISTIQQNHSTDVAIIGGGPAGVSAAIYTARKGLSTTILSTEYGGQLMQTKGIENMISIPYIEGPQLAANLQNHIDKYPIKTMYQRSVLDVKEEKSHFSISLQTNETVHAKAVIVATGAQWKTLNVPGEKDYIGRGVGYCPHCDGPFYKNQNVIVVGGGNSGIEAAIDLAGITKEVTVLEFDSQLKADQVLIEKASSLTNVHTITNAQTTEIIGDGTKVTGLMYLDRKTNTPNKIDIDGIFVQIGLSPNSSCVKDIVETNQYGEIVTNDKGETSIKGIFAAGDVTNVPYKQISVALGEGAKVGLSTFEYLALT